MPLPEQIGRYRIVRQIGQGGMGTVYEARDEELDRSLAIKTIAEPNADAVMRERFRREARAAARIQHPNVCQVYEIGEHDQTIFIAMELLEGESLAARIERGPLPASDALAVATETLSALGALHAHNLVHRDVKPSNIFLGPHGIKLLDFGLAKPPSSSVVQAEALTVSPLTRAGVVVGTPQYMAPEQVEGRSVDGRADLFSLGVIVFEMLSGSRPFRGSSLMELYHAVMYDEPAPLRGVGSAINQIVRRALAKQPGDRYPDAAAMLHDIEAARTGDVSGERPAPRAVTRLMILPFRVLRADPDTDFLAFSIPDAVSHALAGLQSLVVRSAAAGARYAGDVLDLHRIAREAEVDVVLTGSLVRAGDRIRVTTQLIEAPSGTLRWSHAPQLSLQDLFQFQDAAVQGILDSLSLSLTAQERQLIKHDVPASAKAYEFFLRANQAGQAAVALDAASWAAARDLYLQCLDEDPHYAPAWARIGRIYRVTGKWGRPGSEKNLALAEAAFKRALEINPDLSVAHNLYGQLEVDLGRAEDAMLRLIERAKAHGADPELFAGLVQACRFCGLLDASVAAHSQARRLDPTVATSVAQTYFMLGDYGQVLAEDINATPNVRNLALAMLGREAEAIANYRFLEAKLRTRYGDLLQCGRALLEGRRDESLVAAKAVLATELKDPETLFHLGRILARLGERQQAAALLGRAVESGFFCYPALALDSWLDPLRSDTAFVSVLADAEARHRGAHLAFTRAGGRHVLGLTR